MRNRQLLRHLVDGAMTLLLLALMAFMVTGQELHERLGAGMMILFIVHLVLNRKWVKHIIKGSYVPYRIIQTSLVLLAFLSMMGSMVSGVMMSRYVFTFLPIHGGISFARTLHMLSAYWGFLFLSAHLGLHWGIVMAVFRKRLGLKTHSRKRAALLRLFAFGVAAYGGYAFFKHRMADYLFLRSLFVFFDFEQPVLQFFAEYTAMMGLWICVSYYVGKMLARRTKHYAAIDDGKNTG